MMMFELVRKGVFATCRRPFSSGQSFRDATSSFLADGDVANAAPGFVAGATSPLRDASAHHPVMTNFAGANNTSPDLPKAENQSVADAAPPVMVAEGATVEIDGASAQSVSFASTTGTLKLGDALAFTGRVSGLAEADALDLADVKYGANTTATFLGNADGREGWGINQKKTRRVYRELGLQLRNKMPKRRVKAKMLHDRTRPGRWTLSMISWRPAASFGC
jgi:hypothetical protein